MNPSRDISGLLEVMAALRTPETGCPWDLEQDFASIAPYTIEEAYEVADAIERGDMDDLCDELGDLLLQVAYHARMAQEAGEFEFADVVEAITTKMIRRHPHVFGDAERSAAEYSAAGLAKTTWERIKAEEKAERAERRAAKGLPARQESNHLLDAVPATLPALTTALKLQKKAATVGFDWDEPRAVVDKVHEELDETVAAIDGGERVQISDEIGDLLFVVVNLARHLDIDPEAALRGTNAKVRSRFAYVEDKLAERRSSAAQADLDTMERLWQEAKRHDRD